MSSSTFIQIVDKQDVWLIKDVEAYNFTFTDGSGYISPLILQKVADKFKFTKVSAI